MRDAIKKIFPGYMLMETSLGFAPKGFKPKETLLDYADCSDSHREWSQITWREEEDRTDNWQMPSETLKLGTGDCEDIAILDMCWRMSRADRVDFAGILVGWRMDNKAHAVSIVLPEDSSKITYLRPIYLCEYAPNTKFYTFVQMRKR